MSQYLDELARTLATAMPRRRAVRLLGGALIGVAFPAGAARAARATHDCPSQNAFLCQCPNKDLFFKVCCPNKTATDEYKCECFADRAQCTHISKPCDETCGKKCCDETQYCASPNRSLCCKKAERVCIVLPTPGSGRGGGAAKCCPPSRPTCCANDKRASCCDPNDSCCAGACCPPDKTCQNGVCKCPKGTKLCGRECCKGPEKCCGKKCCQKDQTCCGDECCGKDEKCCGGDTCCKKDQTCCGDRCCDKGEKCCGGGETCCKKDETCCGGETCCKPSEICMSTTQQRVLQSSSARSSRTVIRKTCCPKPRALGTTKCCPPGTVAGRTGTSLECCPPGAPNCCADPSGGDDLPCLPGSICVNGTCARL